MPADFDLPYEDLHATKEILRMEMNMLANAINQGSSIQELHALLKETDADIHKLKDPEITKTFRHIWYIIDHNYPIVETTNWEIIESLGTAFRFIDQKTLY